MTPQLFGADMNILVAAILAGFIGASLILMLCTVGPARKYGHGKSLRVFGAMFLLQLYAMGRLRRRLDLGELVKRHAPNLERTLLLDWLAAASVLFVIFLVLRMLRLIRTPVYLLLCYTILAGSMCAIVGFLLLF